MTCKACSLFKFCTWNKIDLIGDTNAPIKFLFPYTTNVSSDSITQDDAISYLKDLLDSMDLSLDNRVNSITGSSIYNIDLLVRCGLTSIQDLTTNPDSLNKCTQENFKLDKTKLMVLVGKDAIGYYLSSYLNRWSLPDTFKLEESDVLELFFAIDPCLFNHYTSSVLQYTDLQIKELATKYSKIKLSNIQYKTYTTTGGLTIVPIQHPFQVKKVDTAFYRNFYRSSIGSIIDRLFPKVDRVHRTLHKSNIKLIKQLFNQMNVDNPDLVSIDIETNGEHFKSNDCKIAAIQIAYKGDEGHLILWDHEESQFSFDDKKEIVRLLKSISHRNIVGQNFIYDYTVLYSQLGIAYNNIDWDTMLAEHFILGGAGDDMGVLDLEYMSAKYLSIFKFKHEMDEFKKRYNILNKLSSSSYHFMLSVPTDILLKYGVDDTINTLRIARKQMEFLRTYRGKDRVDIFRKLTLYKYVAFCHMSINGMYYDPIRVNELSVLYKKHLAKLITDLHNHPLVIDYRNKHLSRAKFLSKKDAKENDTFVKARIPYVYCKHCLHENFLDVSLLKDNKTQCPQCKERCLFTKDKLSKLYVITCGCGYKDEVKRKPKIYLGTDICSCGKVHLIKCKDFYTVDGNISVEKLYKVFSPDSNKTLPDFVYEYLNTPILSKSGKKTVGNIERPYIENYWRDKGREDVLEFFRLFNSYKTETKLYSSYIQNIYKPTVYTYPILASYYKQNFTKCKIENPNLIHPAIRVCGTKTGRPSCGGDKKSKYNIFTLPRNGPVKTFLSSRFNTYYSPVPGVRLQADLSGNELRGLSCASGEQLYRDIFLGISEWKDAHRMGTALSFDMIAQNPGKTIAEIEAMVNDDQRMIGKKNVFAACYGEQAETTARRNGDDIELTKKFHEGHKKANPIIYSYIDAVVHNTIIQGYMESMNGRVYNHDQSFYRDKRRTVPVYPHFRDESTGIWYPNKKTPVYVSQKELSDARRQYAARIAQGPCADICMMGLATLHRKLYDYDKNEAKICYKTSSPFATVIDDSVYDSLVMDTPTPEITSIIELTQESLEIEGHKNNTWMTIPIKSDFELGINYARMLKVKDFDINTNSVIVSTKLPEYIMELREIVNRKNHWVECGDLGKNDYILKFRRTV